MYCCMSESRAMRPVLCLVLVVASVSPFSGLEAQRSDTEILVIQRGSNKAMNVQSGEVWLAQERVMVRPGETVTSILSAKGLRPDGESIAALYQANPGLKASDVVAGATINVPVVRGADRVARAVGSTHFALITLDLSRKLAFLKSVEAFPDAIAAMTDVPAGKIAGGEEGKAAITRDATTILARAKAIGLGIQARTRPVDPYVLGVISDELARATELIDRAPIHGLDEANARVLEAIARDLTLRASYWTDTYGPEQSQLQVYPQAPIHVRALANRGSEHKLRIWWIEEGLLGSTKKPNKFSELSATTQMLGVADYAIWGADPADDSGKPVTRVEIVKVRQQCTPQQMIQGSPACTQAVDLLFTRP